MDGNSSFFKFKVGVEERAVGVACIPTVVEGCLRHGVIGREGIAEAVDDGGDAFFAVEAGDFSEPGVSDFIVFTLESFVEVAGAPEAGFFDF